MLNNSTFYPTPKKLANLMLSKIEGNPERVLDPSAGKGDLLEAIQSKYRYDYSNLSLFAIEKDPDLQATLKGKSFPVLDADFLTFAGPDKFDLILMNPPFDEGDKHLLKAIKVMYRGQIICLLNAETIRNPYTNTRKLLVSKLDELGAEIEYIQGAFLAAERPTGVEVALVNIKIERRVEDDLFAGCSDFASECEETAGMTKELSRGKDIEEMVADYNLTVEKCTQVIIEYYKNYRRCGRFLGLDTEADRYATSRGDMTQMLQDKVNSVVKNIRKAYWQDALSLDEVKKRLTKEKQDEFYGQLETQSMMDFTASNIRQFVLNLIGSYEQTLIDAVVKLFDRFTDHSYNDGPNEKNIHYFNGWKTNSAFKINKKVIIPLYYGTWGSPFLGYDGNWKLNWDAARELADFDKVMNYFDGLNGYHELPTAIKRAFAEGKNRNIKSTYFTATCYKKGTIHLTFNDEDILRRFNIVACKGKGWLPQDYGAKPYEALSIEEKSMVDSFEGRKSYEVHRQDALFSGVSNLKAIA